MASQKSKRQTTRTESVVTEFEFEPGRVLAGKYEVETKLDRGWEGEVYLVREIETGILRAAKLLFPNRNERGRTARFYARKLHKLRHCPVLVQYHGWETIQFQREQITCLISEYVEGEMLEDYLKRQPGGRLQPFPALHLLWALAKGIEPIHAVREYHGDLHSGNVMVQRVGLTFDLKIFDFFHWDSPRPENIRDDVVDLVKIFHESLGGARHYAKQPDVVKEICCGLRRTLILRKFRTAGQLRRHLEAIEW
ncbi:MAG: protein kinase [bacterium]